MRHARDDGGFSDIGRRLQESLDEAALTRSPLVVRNAPAGMRGQEGDLPQMALERLPRLGLAQANELQAAYAAQRLRWDPSSPPPLRRQHHTISRAGLVAEMRLAQYGVLYLSELTMFSLVNVEAVAQALADGWEGMVVASAYDDLDRCAEYLERLDEYVSILDADLFVIAAPCST